MPAAKIAPDPRGAVHARRRLTLLVSLLVLIAVGAFVGFGSSRSEPPAAGSVSAADHIQRTTSRASAVVPPRPLAHLLVSPPAHRTASWTVVAEVHGQPAAWLAQRSGVTLMRFDQTLVHLNLHAGSSDGGTVGWTYGNKITSREIHLLIAAFNGGFKLSYANVGFMSNGHVAAPLKPGLASIVTYTDGATDIGAWQAGVPSAHKTVFSVLQNQRLLVDHGAAATSASGCVISCWGETVGGQTAVARSGLGVKANGQLVWAAGERLLPSELAAALLGAGAVRAVELDINPDWVAGYLYPHHPSGPSPVAVVPEQLGIAGKLLEPDSRDFLAIVAN